MIQELPFGAGKSGVSPMTGFRSSTASTAARTPAAIGTHCSTPILSDSARFRMRP